MNENKLDQKDQQILPSGGRPAQNNDYYEDEIDLFELIHMLLKNKKIIAIISATVTAFAFLISVFVIKPVYQAELKFDLNLPSIVVTEYGEYDTGLTGNQSLADILAEDEFYQNLDKKLGYEGSKTGILNAQDLSQPNRLIIRIKGTDTEKINKLIQVLPDEYKQYLDHKIQKDYLEFYTKYYESEIIKNKKEKEITNELLANARVIAEKQPKFLDNTNEINPNWIKSQGYVMDHLKSIEDINTYIKISEEKLGLIEEEKNNLLESKSENKFTSDIMSLDEETSPLVKISPNVNLNTAIGLVLGLMIGVFYVFTQEWWKNSKDDIKTRWNQYK